MVNWTDSPGSG